MKIKLLALTLFFLLNSTQLFAEIYEVNNEKIKILLECSVPLIDIRTEGEWHETGVIKSSHLLTFFNKDGKYNFKTAHDKQSVDPSNVHSGLVLC